MEYKILDEPMPAVICTVKQGETMITESGAMSWMTPNMKMETSTNGGFGKALGRMFSGESMFQNRYTAEGGDGMITFASSFPGSVKAFDIGEKEIVVQKSAFLASESAVDLSIFFQKKFGAGLFAGEGFIMQKLSGSGLAFCEIDGKAVEYDLEEGQSLIVSTGHVAAMDATCKFDIQAVPGMKNKLLGGEGLFNTIISGPGHVILQTMPINNLASALSPYIVTA